MDLLERLGLKRKKTRREQVRDSMSEAVHSVADALDEMVAESRKRAPKAARQARKKAKRVAHEAPGVARRAQTQLREAGEQVGQVAGEVREQASDLADTLRERTAEPRERVAGAATHVGDATTERTAAMLAALGGLTANWDEIMHALTREMEQRTAPDEEGDKQQKKEKKKQRKKKGRSYPGLWIWLLRLGVGVWFLERLRSRDLSAFIDHGAGDQLRAQSAAHPLPSYKDFMDEFLIPNASIFAMLLVALEALTALGFLTGINRRLAALTGVLLSGHDLMADYGDSEKRGQNLALVLAQLLLLRTGGKLR